MREIDVEFADERPPAISTATKLYIGSAMMALVELVRRQGGEVRISRGEQIATEGVLVVPVLQADGSLVVRLVGEFPGAVTA